MLILAQCASVPAPIAGGASPRCVIFASVATFAVTNIDDVVPLTCREKSTRAFLLLPLYRPSRCEPLATRRARYLPSGGKLERRNWNLRSPTGTQFRSVPTMNAADNAGPVHDGRPPSIAGTSPFHLPGDAARCAC